MRIKMNNILNFHAIENKIINEQYRKYCHTSGLDVYIFPKKMSTTYALLGVKYGSLHSKFKVGDDLITVPDGVAHFLEHKMFTNADGSDSFEKFSALGADANAYTSFNRTAYLFSCTDNFALSLTELLYFVTHPYFTKESVASEIGIIAEEIKMYDDTPSDRCYYGMLEGMYHNNGIKKNICGTVDSISQITPEILYTCHNSFYRPENMMLIVCGDVDDDEILSIVDENIVSSEKSEPIEQIKTLDEPRSVFKAYVERKMQVSKPIFNIGYKDIEISINGAERQKKDAVMSILNEMLFSRAGELYNYLFENNIVSPNFSYGYTISENAAYNSVAGEADDPKKVLDEIQKYIERVKVSGLSIDDFNRGKKVMYAEFVKAFDSTDSIANNMLSFICDDAELLDYSDIVSSVTFEDVCEQFEKSFSKETIVLSVVLPI